MTRDTRALLLIALRASGGRGPHAEAARNVVLALGREVRERPAAPAPSASGRLFRLSLNN